MTAGFVVEIAVIVVASGVKTSPRPAKSRRAPSVNSMV